MCLVKWKKRANIKQCKDCAIVFFPTFSSCSFFSMHINYLPVFMFDLSCSSGYNRNLAAITAIKNPPTKTNSPPDRPFRNFRAWRSGDQQILCSSVTSCDGFWSSKIVKGSVGLSTLLSEARILWHKRPWGRFIKRHKYSKDDRYQHFVPRIGVNFAEGDNGFSNGVGFPANPFPQLSCRIVIKCLCLISAPKLPSIPSWHIGIYSGSCYFSPDSEASFQTEFRRIERKEADLILV